MSLHVPADAEQPSHAHVHPSYDPTPNGIVPATQYAVAVPIPVAAVDIHQTPLPTEPEEPLTRCPPFMLTFFLAIAILCGCLSIGLPIYGRNSDRAMSGGYANYTSYWNYRVCYREEYSLRDECTSVPFDATNSCPQQMIVLGASLAFAFVGVFFCVCALICSLLEFVTRGEPIFGASVWLTMAAIASYTIQWALLIHGANVECPLAKGQSTSLMGGFGATFAGTMILVLLALPIYTISRRCKCVVCCCHS